MAFTRQFKWNGTDVLYPSSITWSFNEISSADSGRTLSGKMLKEIVTTKRKLVCSWKLVDDTAASTLLSAIKANTYGSLTYPDAATGTDQTKTMYTSDPTAEMVAVHNNKCIWNISFEFIEQ